MLHKLKILPSYFEAVIRGTKNFEIRDNSDRGFQCGDTVQLMEIEKGAVHDHYTGREQLVEITYVTAYNQPQNQVVFGFSLMGDIIQN